jgi:aryl-alcohol dehydrogenase-like predicted oxidoreductase
MGWVLSRSEIIVPIPGTRSIAHLDEDLSAAHLTIDPAVLAKVEAIFAPGAIAGPRYAPAMQAQIDTELLPEEA